MMMAHFQISPSLTLILNPLFSAWFLQERVIDMSWNQRAVFFVTLTAGLWGGGVDAGSNVGLPAAAFIIRAPDLGHNSNSVRRLADRAHAPASLPSTTRLQAATFGGEMRGLSIDKSSVDGIRMLELQRQDLREAATVCVEAFFGDTKNSKNPVRALQLASLVDEQLTDLKSRWNQGPRAVMLKAVDEETGAILGFVEVSASPGNKYGFGAEKEVRPYLANLCVRMSARRRGIGRRLAQACEDLARSWGYDDILLQVEDDNTAARELYKSLGYIEFFQNRGGRRYDLSGFSIRSVSVTKVYMRKSWEKPSPVEQVWNYLQSSIVALQQQ